MENNIEELVKQLREASDAYYNNEEDTELLMTDDEFDSNLELLRELDPENEFFSQVGSAPSTYRESKPHHGTIGSLVKLQLDHINKDNMDNYLNGVLSLKADGASLVLYYDEDGKFYQALVRGNGTHGNDVTDNVIKMKFPRQVHKGILSVRCEGVISYEDFESHFKSEGNIRNKASGLINSKYSSDEDLSKVKIVAININSIKEDSPSFTHHYGEQGILLKNLGFDIIRGFYCADYEDLQMHLKGSLNINEFENLEIASDSGNYHIPVDGVVLEKTNFNPVNMDGYVWLQPVAKAIKFPQPEYITTVVGWNLQLSGFGRVIPVLQVEPVQIGGSTLRRVTANNFNWITKRKLGIGAKIKVKMANGIIPNLVDTIEPVEPEVPTHHEGYELEWRGVHLVAKNYVNIENIFQRIFYHYSPKGIGYSGYRALFDYYQPSSVSRYIEILKSIADGVIEEDLPLGNAARKHLTTLANNLVNDSISPGLLFYLSMIPNYGGSSCGSLDKLVDIEKFKESLDNNEIPQVAYDAASTYLGRVGLELMFPYIKELYDSVRDQISAPVIKEEIPSKGTFAVTGKLSVPRKQLLAEFAEVGYTMADVGKADLLIADGESSSSKYKSAVNRKIPIMTEQEFRDRFIGSK